MAEDKISDKPSTAWLAIEDSFNYYLPGILCVMDLLVFLYISAHPTLDINQPGIEKVLQNQVHTLLSLSYASISRGLSCGVASKLPVTSVRSHGLVYAERPDAPVYVGCLGIDHNLVTILALIADCVEPNVVREIQPTAEMKE
jgi:hypothetical protein